MKTNFYITVNSKGAVKVSKNPRYTDWDEVCIGVGLVLPDQLFKRPSISATIVVGHDDVKPFIINADTSNLVKDAIEQSTGLKVELTISNPESEG